MRGNRKIKLDFKRAGVDCSTPVFFRTNIVQNSSQCAVPILTQPERCSRETEGNKENKENVGEMFVYFTEILIFSAAPKSHESQHNVFCSLSSLCLLLLQLDCSGSVQGSQSELFWRSAGGLFEGNTKTVRALEAAHAGHDFNFVIGFA